jgi:hypothetical protein
MALETIQEIPDKRVVTVALHPALYAKLQRAAETRSTPARKVTLADVLRDLIDSGC